MKFRITYLLIAITCITFAFGWVWPLNLAGEPATVLLYGFSHVSGLHLAFNMLALLTFGLGVERALGKTDTLGLYLMGIVFGGLSQTLFGDGTPVVGASAGIFAILLAYGIIYPDKRVMLLVFPMRAQSLILWYVLIELTMTITGWVPGIAHAAHIGGAVAGATYMLFWRWEQGHA